MTKTDVYLQVRIILGAFWRRRYVWAASILIMPLLSFFVGVMSPQKYIATSSVLIQEPAMLNPFLTDLAVPTQIDKRIAAIETLLESRNSMTKIATELGFINEDMSDVEKSIVIGQLERNLSVRLVGNNLVTFQYQASYPDDMAKVLNLVMANFITETLSPQLSSISSSEQFLSQQLEEKRVELDQAETLLAEYKTEQSDQLPEIYNSLVAGMQLLKTSLAEKQSNLAGARAGLDGLRDTLVKTNPVLGKIEEEIVSVLGNIAILRSRYTEQHSEVQALSHKLERLEYERGRLLAEISELDDTDIDRLWDLAISQSSNAGSEHQPLLVGYLAELQKAQSLVQSLEQEVVSIESQITELEPKIRNYGVNEKTLNELERDLKVKREIYERLLERHEMAKVTGDLSRYEQQERVQIIDYPNNPAAPTNLPAVVFAIAGIFAGLFMGIGLVIMLEMINTTVITRAEIQRIAGVVVLARVPNLKSKEAL